MLQRLSIINAALLLSSVAAFQPLTVTRRISSLLSANTADELDAGLVNGEGAASVTGGLITSEDAKSQLFSAFAALDMGDQYDAVLTGLCAKILDDASIKEDAVVTKLQDPIQLLQEMNMKNIQASPRSLMALIDSTVKAQDAKVMAQILSACIKNGGVCYFGSLQADVLALPATADSKVKCPDGSIKTRKDRLGSVADIPVDERAREVANALAVAGVAAACGFTDVAHMNDITPYSNALLSTIVAVGVVDNFYDILKSGSTMVVKQLAKDSDKGKDFNLPDKESLPLGLGSGQISGSVVRGLSRLLTIDAERESQCESAALFVAYALGLPCFAYRPNALEASVLVVESIRDDNDLDPLLSSSGIMRVLVWLMAPVAAESMKHPVCIFSDPREAESFLTRLEEYAESNPEIADDIFWAGNEQEKRDLLKWAYTEADLLLRENTAIIKEVSNRLEGGAATIGDCIAAMEQW